LRQFFVHQLHQQRCIATPVVAVIPASARCCGLQPIDPSQYCVAAQMHRFCAFERPLLRSSDEKQGAIDRLEPNYASKNKKNVRLDTVTF
jgi:hypothetical protein